jgi:hypothetical protein
VLLSMSGSKTEACCKLSIRGERVEAVLPVWVICQECAEILKFAKERIILTAKLVKNILVGEKLNSGK